MKATTIQTGKASPTAKTIIKVLLLSGLLSSLFYFATDLLASWWYVGYSCTDQNCSEFQSRWI